MGRILSPLEWLDDEEEAQLDALTFRDDHGGDLELFQEAADLELEKNDLQIQAGSQALADASVSEFEAFAASDLTEIVDAEEHDLSIAKLHADPATLTPEERDIIGGAIGSEPIRRPAEQPTTGFGEGPGDLRTENMRPAPPSQFADFSLDDIQDEIRFIAQLDRAEQDPVRFQALLDEQRNRAQEGSSPARDFVGKGLEALNFGIGQVQRGMGAFQGTGVGQAVNRGLDYYLNPIEEIQGSGGRPDDVGQARREFSRSDHFREEMDAISETIPKEVLDQLDRTIGFSFAEDPVRRYEAIVDLSWAYEDFLRTTGEQLAAVTPDAPPIGLSEFQAGFIPPPPEADATDIQRIMSQNAARFSAQFQDITDKYGIAYAQIVGNVFFDPLNLIGFGLLGKIPLAGRILGPLEMAYIRGTDKLFNAAGKGFKQVVGVGRQTIIEGEAGIAAKQAELFLSRRAGLFTDDMGVVDDLVNAAKGPDGLGDGFENVQKVFDSDMYDTLPQILNGQTPAQAVDTINSHARKTVKAELEAGSDAMPAHIQEQLGLVRNMMDKLPEGATAWQRSAFVTKGLKKPIDFVHNNIQLPLAQAQLFFLLYAPWNYIETLGFSMLTGSAPGIMAAREFDAVRVVLGTPAPVIGGSKDFAGYQARSLARQEQGARWFDWWQNTRENWDETLDAGIRRNNYVDQLKKNIDSEPVLKERFDSVRQSVIQDLPPELRPHADNIGDMAGIYAVTEPSALPQIADFYGTPQIKGKVMASLANEFQDLPPDVLHTLSDFGSGRINSSQLLRKQAQEALETHALNDAYSQPAILSDYVNEIEVLVRDAAESGAAGDLGYAADAWQNAKFRNQQAFTRIEAMANLKREILNTSQRGKQLRESIRQLDGEIAQAKLQLRETRQRLKDIGNEFGLGRETSLSVSGELDEFNSRFDDILDRSQDYHDEFVEPAQRFAQDTNSRELRKQRWDEASVLRRRNWAQRDKELSELLAETFPQFGVDNPLQAQTVERMTDILGPAQKRLDEMLDKVDQMSVVKGGEADTGVLRENLSDLATSITSRETPGLSQQPRFTGRAYRAASGFRQGPGATAADVIRYETDQLGNTFPTLAGETIGELGARAADDVVWVTRTREQARRYGDVVEEVQLPKNARVLQDLGDDGVLVYRGEVGESLRPAADKAIKRTTDRYEATFIQYPGNNLDAIMRYVDPFWVYQSRRLVRTYKAGAQHPGLIRLYEQYYEDSDRGYLSFNGIRWQIDPTRGSIMSLIGANKRRGSGMDLNALLNGDFKNVIRGDRFDNRFEDDIEKVEEIANSLGIYPGAMLELPVALYRAIFQAVRKAQGDDPLRAMELGNFVPPLMENIINLAEVAGVDTGKLRDFLHNPFYQPQIKLVLADQVARGEPEDMTDARRQVGVDQIIGQQTGFTRVRTSENLQRKGIVDETMAELRGLTVDQVKAQRQSRDYVPPDPYEAAIIEDKVGRREAQLVRESSQEYRGGRLREISQQINKKRTKQTALLARWRTDFEKIKNDLIQYGSIYGEEFEGQTLNQIMQRFWRQWNDIDAEYVDDIPQTEAEWRAAQDLYGIAPKDTTAFGQVYKDYRAIRPENAEYQMTLGETDWDAFFTDQENFLADLSPDNRDKLEAITQLRDAYTEIPFVKTLREAAQIRRKYYDEPRFFRIGGNDEIIPYSEADQQKLATAERQINLFVLDAQNSTLDVGADGGMVLKTPLGGTVDEQLQGLPRARRIIPVPEVGFVNGQLKAATPDGEIDANATYFAEQIYLDEARRGRIPTGLFADAAEVEAAVSKLRFTRASENYLRRNDRFTPRREFLEKHRANPDERFPGSNRSLYDVVYEGRSVSFE